MVTSEKEMVRPLVEDPADQFKERNTVLQPTYEDSVPPDEEYDWEDEAS
jgi:hypothetical protein